ncbi:MAG: hypothetical protein H7Y88_00975 [Phycisphaerales bacterium]|nr:hypothetical protein [Phycisphaerales bacterium]
MLARFRVLVPAAVVASFSVLALNPFVARADEFVDRVNAPYSRISDAKRSDLVVLPLLAKMAAVPGGLQDGGMLEDAALLTHEQAAFAEAAAWAQAPEQKAVLEALARVTEDDDPETRMVFAQPYGVEGAAPELVEVGMYTDLGDPPLLAAAKFGYLDGLEAVGLLAFVEAQRLVGEGKPGEAMEVLLDLIAFGRQLTDRAFVKERALGEMMMFIGFVSIRDIAYRDSKASTHALTSDGIRAVIRRLDDRRATVGLERMLIPTGDQVALEQLLNRIYTSSGAADPESFATTLSSLSAAERPLRLFSEAARWDQVRAVAAPAEETRRALSRMYSDWVRRWSLQVSDPLLSSPTDFSKVVQGRPNMAVLELAAPAERLFATRKNLMTEAAGTRMSLAMYGQFLKQGSYPLALTAVRPSFIQTIDVDPYIPSRSIRFFVPVRDTKGPQGTAQPLEMRVFPRKPLKPFSITLRDDVFVMYSIGPDEDDGHAQNITQSDSGGDYLLWPPMLSLLRQSLIDQGELE